MLAVLAVVLVLYGGGRWLEKRAEKPETRTQLPQADQETVEVDGVTYRKKSRLTTILVMGVDHDTQDSYEYRKAGQADFLRLVVLDDADEDGAAAADRPRIPLTSGDGVGPAG